MVRDEFVKIESEEWNSINKQISPLKTRYSSIRQHNRKRSKKWGFQNLVCTGISGFMYDFFIYDEKESEEVNDKRFGHLQNMLKLFQSHTMIFLITKRIKGSLTTVSKRRISYINLDQKKYMLSVQFNWTVWEIFFLMKTKILSLKISSKWQRHYGLHLW